MTSAKAHHLTELVDLGRDECLQLLAGVAIGRIVITDNALPAAHPVLFLLDDEEAVFRTMDDRKIVTGARNRVVAFQADALDFDTRTGWTVLGMGEAYEVTDTTRLANLAGLLPATWVVGADARTFAVPLQRLTGRQLRRCAAPCDPG